MSEAIDNLNKNIIYAAINIGDRYISAMLASERATSLVPLYIESIEIKGILHHGKVDNPNEFRAKMESIISAFRSTLRRRFKDEVELSSVNIGINPRSLCIREFSQNKEFDGETAITNGVLDFLSKEVEELALEELNKEHKKLTILKKLSSTYYTDYDLSNPKTRENIHHLKKNHLEQRDKYICMREDYLLEMQDIFKKTNSLKDLNYKFIPNPLAEARLWESKDVQNYVFINMGAGSTTILKDPNGLEPELFVLPLGGNTITKDISSYFGISWDKSEELKIQESAINNIKESGVWMPDVVEEHPMVEDKEINRADLDGLVYSRVLEILINVASVIRKIYPKGTPNKLIFYGGSARLRGFESLVQERIFSKYELEVRQEHHSKIDKYIDDCMEVYANNRELYQKINDDQMCTLISLILSANGSVDITCKHLFNQEIEEEEEELETSSSTLENSGEPSIKAEDTSRLLQETVRQDDLEEKAESKNRNSQSVLNIGKGLWDRFNSSSSKPKGNDPKDDRSQSKEEKPSRQEVKEETEEEQNIDFFGEDDLFGI